MAMSHLRRLVCFLIQNPQISIYKSESGTWFCETSDNTTMINDGDDTSEHMLWRFMSMTPLIRQELKIQVSKYIKPHSALMSAVMKNMYFNISIDGEAHSLGERYITTYC